MRDLNRRGVIGLIGGAAAWPIAAGAQQSGIPVVGYLSSLGQAVSVQFDAAFRRRSFPNGLYRGSECLDRLPLDIRQL